MNEHDNVVDLLQDLKSLLAHTKKVYNINELIKYTSLSRSKIYKLSHLKLNPTGNNRHILQLFFYKEEIDTWLGEANISDEFLER